MRRSASNDVKPVHPAKRQHREGEQLPSLPITAQHFVLVLNDIDFAFSRLLCGALGSGCRLFCSTPLAQEACLAQSPEAWGNINFLEARQAIVNYQMDITTPFELGTSFDFVCFPFSPPTPEEQRRSRDFGEPDKRRSLVAFLRNSPSLVFPDTGQLVIVSPSVGTAAEGCFFIDAAAAADEQNSAYLEALGTITLQFAASADDGDCFVEEASRVHTLRFLRIRSGVSAPKPRKYRANSPPLAQLTETATRGEPKNSEAKTKKPQQPDATVVSQGKHRLVIVDQFKFSKADDHGVMYHIGKIAGKGSWLNPVIAKLVRVTTSGLGQGSREGTEVGDAEFSNQVYYTENVPGSWVMIDFGKYWVEPARYRMSHRARVADYFLRSWVLEASEDAKKWMLLSNHVNDESLNAKSPTAVWRLPQMQFFRFFRVRIMSKGNSHKSNALVVSCFELFGRLAVEATKK
eukprot:TRINITY_DN27766_c0_g1_i1.p1 TRINITY_DN27766_c0_g1~~TRINITY_DN27766_c0_g1_i1.p1  ORF type:complete len:461 (+),score=68.90 TRINITY_DN27766_c0_g1_i1:1167-2549(+)